MAEYWTIETDEKIFEYVAEIDLNKRNQIFEQHLEFPTYKLSENIFHRFKKTDDPDKNGVNDLHQFIVGNLDRCERSKGRPFSYLSMCGKHYIMQANVKKVSSDNRFVSLDAALEIQDDEGETLYNRLAVEEPSMFQDKQIIEKVCDYFNDERICKLVLEDAKHMDSSRPKRKLKDIERMRFTIHCLRQGLASFNKRRIGIWNKYARFIDYKVFGL